MAIIKNFDPQKIYVSERLREKFKIIFKNTLTIVEAPTGFGKSTSIRELLKLEDADVVWFNISSDNASEFYKDLAERMKTISEECSVKMLAIGTPKSKQEAKKLAGILMQVKFNKPTVLVFDNYQKISDEYSNEMIMALAGNTYNNLMVVCLTQSINSNFVLELVMKKKLNYIGSEWFELDKKEIYEYYKLCGIKLNESEVDYLYEHTEGWISALYLLMLNISEDINFDISLNVDSLISKSVWDRLTADEQDFLIHMSVFDTFTLRQAVYMYENSLSEEQIKDIIKKCGFIKFEPKTRKYHIHSILLYFIENEFEKLELVFKKRIYKFAAGWFKDNEDYLKAIEYYHMIRDFEAILEMDYKADVFININLKRYHKLIADVIENTSFEVKCRHIRKYMIYVFFMFVYNKKDLLKQEIDKIEHMILTDRFDFETKNYVEGNLYCLKGILCYNDIEKMIEMFTKAYEILNHSSDIMSNLGSSIFDCPSMVSMYHTKAGKLKEETDNMAVLMPIYYKLSDGKDKGIDAVMKAEMLMLKGELADAEKLCNKALYRAETSGAVNVYFCAKLVLARIHFFKGEYERITEIAAEVNDTIIESKLYELSTMNDLCLGCIMALSEQHENIPSWLKSSASIEEKCNIHNICFANVIYSKDLLLDEQYDLFESISGSLLATTGVNNNIIYRIYILMYLSIVKYAKGDINKSKVFMVEALELAKDDEIIIPFAENYNSLINIFATLEINSEYRDIISNVKKFATNFDKSLKDALKVTKNAKNFGLTKRELEIAKLAADRLTNKEIAEELFIAESTVKSTMKLIFNKLSINSRNDLRDYF